MKVRIATSFMLLAMTSAITQAVTLQPYSAQAVKEAQNAGKPHAIHFHADWCSTCVAQEKVLNSLKNDKEVDMTVYVADYDKEKDLKKQLNVRSQSVMVVYRGPEEKARLAGDTNADKIKTTLKKAF